MGAKIQLLTYSELYVLKNSMCLMTTHFCAGSSLVILNKIMLAFCKNVVGYLEKRIFAQNFIA